MVFQPVMTNVDPPSPELVWVVHIPVAQPLLGNMRFAQGSVGDDGGVDPVEFGPAPGSALIKMAADSDHSVIDTDEEFTASA